MIFYVEKQLIFRKQNLEIQYKYVKNILKVIITNFIKICLKCSLFIGLSEHQYDRFNKYESGYKSNKINLLLQ